MPKILINEKDRTLPGTPDSYSNYSVLIIGFTGRQPVLTAEATDENPADAIQPDSNGVYEFSSAADFEATIGLAAPYITINKEEGAIGLYHYGNQMAYELLNMGYTIVYRPISEIADVKKDGFWDIFKDKASYDFRFITHGFLESSDITNSEEYLAKAARLGQVQEALAEINRIENDYSSISDRDAEYANIKNTYEGFKPVGSTKYYSDFATASAGVKAEKEQLENDMTSLTAGGIDEELINRVNGDIANLAAYVAGDNSSGRGDCIALIELDERGYSTRNTSTKPEVLIIDKINKMSQINESNGSYCALTVPSVHYKMADNNAFGNNKKFPGSFHYLACFISSLRVGFAEWYAAAGYTRGVSSYVIDHTTVKLGEIAINALEPRNMTGSDSPKFACNVIANFRGSYYLWGNRTCYRLGDANGTEGDLVARHFLNIRQLCTTIKKQLYVACRRFTFDPNSDTLWINFTNAIRPTLEAMKADQGIRDYKILKEYTDKKATLKAKIRIIPIEAVEDFDLEVSLEDSFGETAAVVTE